MTAAIKAETDAMVARMRRHPYAEDYVAEIDAITKRIQRQGEAAVERYNAATGASNARFDATSLKRLKDAGVSL